MKQLENLIIVWMILKTSDDEVHLNYYEEKCNTFLGYVPDPSFFFEDIGKPFYKKMINFGIVMDMIVNSGELQKVSRTNHIHRYEISGVKTVRIYGVHELLTRRILEEIEVMFKRKDKMRDVKLKTLLI